VAAGVTPELRGVGLCLYALGPRFGQDFLYQLLDEGHLSLVELYALSAPVKMP